MSKPLSETSAAKGRKAALRAAVAILTFLALTALAFLLPAEDRYLWIKALHVIAVIAWMAGMLYLPRLFVYHCDAEPGSIQAETFAVMERRLIKVIMTPAMIVSWVLGLWLAYEAGVFAQAWFIAKLVAVLAMSGMHGHLSKAARRFAAGENDKSAQYWRLMNEVPTVIMIVTVVLVIVRPF